MKQENEHLDSLKDIKDMMEKSTKFISLSGISGVLVGIVALIGAGIALKLSIDAYDTKNVFLDRLDQGAEGDLILYLMLDAFSILVISLFIGFFFTYRKMKKTGQKFFDKSAIRLFTNMMIPLATGGILCLILLSHGLFYLLAPLTLIFYGLALINGSYYTVKEIRYLGICEIVLGLVATVALGNGLLFWAIGFGVLHIIYGIVMYYKYDRK